MATLYRWLWRTTPDPVPAPWVWAIKTATAMMRTLGYADGYLLSLARGR